MTPLPLVILGAGEHARVVAEAAATRPAEWTVLGLVDRADAAVGGHRPPDVPPVLADDETYADRLRNAPSHERPRLVVGVGADMSVRRAIVDRYADLASWATVVHAAAWVSPTAVLEPGAVVLGGAVVNTGARIGAHAIVNSGAIVEHDVVIGPFAHVAPGAAVGGGATIGAGTLVGLGARVRDHIEIGRDAVVGMGAVVVESIPDDVVVVGDPARIRSPVDV